MSLLSRLLGRLKRAIGKRPLTSQELRPVRDQMATISDTVTADLAAQVASGAMTVADWQTAMSQQVARVVIGNYLLGRGGKQALTDADRQQLAALLSTQQAYLQNFAADVTNGMSEQAIANRASLYSDAGVGAYERGMLANYDLDWSGPTPPAHASCRCDLDIEDDGDEWLVSWQTEGDRRVCPQCEALGDQYDGYRVPKRGATANEDGE